MAGEAIDLVSDLRRESMFGPRQGRYLHRRDAGYSSTLRRSTIS